MDERGKSLSVLTLNTLAFTVCFAVWMLNGVLVTFLVDNHLFAFTKVQVGWLMGLPVLTGSLLRRPMGLLTDRYGGRAVCPVVMLLSAASAWGLSYAAGYGGFIAGSLGFGLAGSSFAVGIAYTSLWFAKERQGTALGVFGAGNIGSALTSLFAPQLLRWLTRGGQDLEAWRSLPRLYAGLLIVTTAAFLVATTNRVPERSKAKTLAGQLAPLRSLRVWRFGLYYFLVFGGFVALSQWLIAYYVSAYGMSLAVAGALAAMFSLPAGLVRALGGWLADRFGARSMMYRVLSVICVGCLLLFAPRMDITSPGEGVMAAKPGAVTSVTPEEIVAGGVRYPLVKRAPAGLIHSERNLIWPTSERWQEPAVKVGDTVERKQLLANGVTHIYFQANVWVFTFLVFLIGVGMGLGMGAVFKYSPDYFPAEVGVVGGIVGVLGGLGGFVTPIIFGYLLSRTGLWTSSWMFLFVLAVACFAWLHLIVRRLTKAKAPKPAEPVDEPKLRLARAV